MTSSSLSSKLVVVKVGGDVLLDEAQRTGLGKNVRDLVDAGARVVMLHGGGPQVTALQEKLGLKATKIAGRRVTSRDDIVVVAQAICGEVNVGLVSTLIAAGVDAWIGWNGAMWNREETPRFSARRFIAFTKPRSGVGQVPRGDSYSADSEEHRSPFPTPHLFAWC